LSYVDDILIYSNDWNAHLQQLALALQTLKENNISCSPMKTEIGFVDVKYLGHRLTAETVQISEKRVEAIGKIQPPKNVKALQSILGMFNYWKKYLKDYSKHTYHMRQLLKKDVEFKWTPECQAELDYLKSCLASDPILKPVDLNCDLVISCDALVLLSCRQMMTACCTQLGMVHTPQHQHRLIIQQKTWKLRV